MWPLWGSFTRRPERPCPRQSRIATSKFRASSSPMTSKYFSMNSARPGKTAIVPAQAAPQFQRAARKVQLSRAAMAETTAPGGAGFSKIVQSSIAKFRCSEALPGRNFNRAGRFSGTHYRRNFRLSCPSCKAKPYPHIDIARAASGRASGGEPWAPRGSCRQIVSRRFVNVVGTTTFLASFKEDSEMRQFDLSPLYRSTIGFDRLFNMIDQAAGLETMPSYPPYNIERTGENAYRISVAVAGFAVTDLSIETKENTLSIRGSRERDGENATAKPEVLYQGIAGRSFERRFQLADHVHVTGANLENGLLYGDLARELREQQKPRKIRIGNEGEKSTIATPRAAYLREPGGSLPRPAQRRKG